jgi:hypothetical protein
MGRRVLVVVDDDVLRREVNARLSGNSFRASAELPIKNEHRGRNAGGESLSPPESGQTLPEVALGRRLGDPLWDTSGDDPTEHSDECQTFDALTG